MHVEGDGAPRDPLLPGAVAGAACERCGAREMDDADGAFALDTVLACLFCQDADGASYVPVHLAAASSSDAPSTEPQDGRAAEPLIGGARRRRGREPLVPYTGALESHRGCGRCWLRWEAQQISAAAEAGERIDLAVKCPVCNLAVDIRSAYDEALCAPCQRRVVARGNETALALAKAKACCHRCRGVVALGILCTVFGIQALFSMVLWELFESQISKAADDPGGFLTIGGQQGQHGGAGSVFNVSVAAAAAAGIFMS